VWLALGVARRGLRDYDGAEAAYRHALKLAPDDPRAWFNLGVLAQDHRVAVADESDEWIELATEAAEHFRTFIINANHPRWRGQVAEAKDRVAIAEDTVETLELMKTFVLVEEPYGRSPDEISRLLELEAEATSLEELIGVTSPP
jgi:tetratricopeptide (TPR) repeat protein